MPRPLFDLSTIDLNKVVADRADIEEAIPQRYEFAMLDGIIEINPDARRIVAFKDVRTDEFWVRGHIPGKPLFPGVLMVEAAAQMFSYYVRRCLGDERFVAFGGIDEFKFRGQVVPPARLILLGKVVEIRRRRYVSAVQGIVDGTIVFEGKITGLPV